ncbi:54S ribosomal protein L6 mitochondrial [Tieghemiomyces parasiticus]|uniref:54S ribosomal protein L6 mitochondrial n=1 Tax=Tieghemiomyces parasiticus TaxID=78921 RepID=A0A9W8AEP8_9FUNG|nr:54S ribosomal protein L6 mitochondrial [Tieghemiomyces parasiticus]
MASLRTWLNRTLTPASLLTQRAFSTRGQVVLSYTGRQPLSIPNEVEFTHEQEPYRPEDARFSHTTRVRVKGPLGELFFPIEPYVKLEDCPLTEDDQSLNRRRVAISVDDGSKKKQRSMWGTTRTIIQNHITGVSEGFSVPLRLVGVGYRATLESEPGTGRPMLSMKLGYSHMVDMVVPEGITATLPNPTRIVLRGADRQQVKLFAANIRAKRKPEPYNLKGIFVGDETIKKKEGKKK